MDNVGGRKDYQEREKNYHNKHRFRQDKSETYEENTLELDKRQNNMKF